MARTFDCRQGSACYQERSVRIAQGQMTRKKKVKAETGLEEALCEVSGLPFPPPAASSGGVGVLVS